MTTFALTPTEQAPQSFVELVTSSARTGTGSDLWATPSTVVAGVCAALRWPLPSLDIAAVDATRKAPRYFGPDHADPLRRCGLRGIERDPVAGASVAWCNPPWSNVAPWLARCEELAAQGWRVLALVPLRPDTRAWKRYVWQGSASFVLCADRRIAFEIDGAPGSACPHAVAVVAWERFVVGPVRPSWRLWEVAPTSADEIQTSLLEPEE